MKRTREDARKTRQDLLAAAVEIFFHSGVARATLDQIARAAGVTRGALYWHFRDKEDLFDALCQKRFTEMEQQLDGPSCADDPNYDLPALLQTFTGFMQRIAADEQERKFFAILHLKCEETEDNRGITDLLQRYRDLMTARVRTAIERSREKGELPANLDIGMATHLLQSCLLGITSLWLMGPHKFDLYQQATPMLQACAHMLAHSPTLRCNLPSDAV